MRPSFLPRLGIAVCGTLFLCLFSAAVAEAAPRARSYGVCSAQPTPNSIGRRGKGAVRAHQAKSTPPASARRYLVRTHRLVHQHPGLWLERSRATLLPENDAAALQDRTAVVTGEDDLLRLASLEPLDALWFAQSPVTVSGVVARRSPRGPPPLPGLA